jgi:hypothetical protein
MSRIYLLSNDLALMSTYADTLYRVPLKFNYSLAFVLKNQVVIATPGKRTET